LAGKGGVWPVLAQILEESAGVFLSATISRPKNASVVVKTPLIIGFDTEYRPADRSLLSVQFAVRSALGVIESRVYYPPHPKLSVGDFATLLFTFMADVAVPPPSQRRVYLVAHFAQAELGGFEDPLRDWDIRQVGKAHAARITLTASDGRSWGVRLLDLFGYFPTSLASVGESIGLPKLDVDASNLESLLSADPGAFETYAKRDAEIAVLALERFRAKTLQGWGIDVLERPTLASLASDIFRRHFLKSYPAPVRSEIVVERRRHGEGYRQVTRKVLKFNGSSDVRLMACRSYWGGRTEAFIHGLYVGPVVMRDVVSLYPHAAILQPLPTERTKWESVPSVDAVAAMEGFGQFEFEFPTGTMYPCLPVVREGIGRLVFPRKGETYCTFAEIRAALVMGADVEPIRAWGFHPGAREREHDIGGYMKKFLAQKNAEAKGSIEYETAKLLLNALIGKFSERRRDSMVVRMERQARAHGAPGVVALFAKAGVTRGASLRSVATGSAWAPEWSALILGKSRALMAPMVARGALLVSTDAVVMPAGVALDTDSFRDLERVGSGLVDEAVGDAAFIVRSRLYGVLRKPENLTPDQIVLAQDKNWVVLKVARHGSPETKPQFAQTILDCLAARRDVTGPVGKVRLLGARQSVLSDQPLNESIVENRQTHLRWDGKRALRDRDVNIFTSFTQTDPYVTIGKLSAAEHQRRVRAGDARRKRDALAPGTMDRVLAMLEAGASAREIEAETRVPKSTVQDMKRRFHLRDEGDK
jgi:hypothetical protein